MIEAKEWTAWAKKHSKRMLDRFCWAQILKLWFQLLCLLWCRESERMVSETQTSVTTTTSRSDSASHEPKHTSRLCKGCSTKKPGVSKCCITCLGLHNRPKLNPVEMIWDELDEKSSQQVFLDSLKKAEKHTRWWLHKAGWENATQKVSVQRWLII